MSRNKFVFFAVPILDIVKFQQFDENKVLLSKWTLLKIQTTKPLFQGYWHYLLLFKHYKRLLWSWSYGSWIYNNLCNQCLSPLTLWVRTPLRRGVLYTMLCDNVCQWLATGRWFSPCTPISSTNKTHCHDITEILLKVTFNIINLNLNNLKNIKLCWVLLSFSEHQEKLP